MTYLLAMRVKLNQLRRLLREQTQVGPVERVSVVPNLSNSKLVWCISYGDAYGEVDAETGEMKNLMVSGDSEVFNAVMGALSEWCTVDAEVYSLENRDKVVGELDDDPAT
jgi:hypothetical protein